MTPSIHNHPSTPRQAARRRSDLDRRLDPELFKVLGEPTRARLVACLVKCGRPCSVTEVAECCSIDFSMVARHLAALARVGVLQSRKEGRTVWYRVDSPALAARFRSLAEAIDEWAHAGDCGCAATPPTPGTPATTPHKGRTCP